MCCIASVVVDRVFAGYFSANAMIPQGLCMDGQACLHAAKALSPCLCVSFMSYHSVHMYVYAAGSSAYRAGIVHISMCKAPSQTGVRLWLHSAWTG